MFEHSDYLRDQAIKYRELAEKGKDVLAIKEFLKLADICEEVANDIDDRRVSGCGSFAVEQGMVKVTTLKGQRATQVGVFNTTWLARYLLRELAAEGKA